MYSDSRKAQQNGDALRRANLLFANPSVSNLPRVGTTADLRSGDRESVLAKDLKSRVGAGIRGFVPASALA
jgi:hypothetical protein